MPYNRVGVVFCARQSPGGHNVIWGLYDAVKAHNPKSTLLGFVGMNVFTPYYFLLFMAWYRSQHIPSPCFLFIYIQIKKFL